MDSNLELLGGFTQAREKFKVIGGIPKDRLAVVTALNNVMGLIGNNQPGKSGHGFALKLI